MWAQASGFTPHQAGLCCPLQIEDRRDPSYHDTAVRFNEARLQRVRKVWTHGPRVVAMVIVQILVRGHAELGGLSLTEGG